MKIFVIVLVAVVALVALGGLIARTQGNSNTTTLSSKNNISLVGDKQIIEIETKGGYAPRTSIARAGIPTILRFTTNNTFDCSSSISIPALRINRYLPASGTTDIDVGIAQVGTLRGTCGMGMYGFEIDFQN